MRLTARALNRATLRRQLLLRREAVGVVEGLRRVVALQAQQPASPYLALWNRLADFDPTALDRAFAEGAVVKASLMRITLHAVSADDHATFRAAMRPTLQDRLRDPRFTVTGLAPDDLDVLCTDLLDFAAQPRTVPELNGWLAARLGTDPGDPGPLWGLRTVAPLLHAPTGGPWSFGQRPSYVAAPRRDTGDPDVALEVLARRYLEGFGPASVADLAQFAMVPRRRARAALTSLAESLVRLEGPGGEILHDVPDGSLPDEATPAPPRLMAMWDSTLLAHHDRSRLIPPDYRRVVIRANGDVLPTLLVDGHVAGVWRPVEGGIEASALHRLSTADWDGLAAEAARLLGLLAGREPQVYGRYRHWWQKLSGAEVRVLPGP